MTFFLEARVTFCVNISCHGGAKPHPLIVPSAFPPWSTDIIMRHSQHKGAAQLKQHQLLPQPVHWGYKAVPLPLINDKFPILRKGFSHFWEIHRSTLRGVLEILPPFSSVTPVFSKGLFVSPFSAPGERLGLKLQNPMRYSWVAGL